MKIAQNLALLLIVFIPLAYGCKEDDEPVASQSSEKKNVTVSDSHFTDAKDESDFNIREVSISKDCMTITYTYGGGCGDIFTDLVASEQNVQTSQGLHRELKLSIDDQDNCEAQITKSEEFDISALQGEDNTVVVRLHKWDEDIIYTY